MWRRRRLEDGGESGEEKIGLPVRFRNDPQAEIARWYCAKINSKRPEQIE